MFTRCFLVGTDESIVVAYIRISIMIIRIHPSRFRRVTNGSCDIVAAIDCIDDDVVMISTDVDKSMPLDVSLAGTAEHLSADANDRRSLIRRRSPLRYTNRQMPNDQ